jgi:hypothetical protein
MSYSLTHMYRNGLVYSIVMFIYGWYMCETMVIETNRDIASISSSYSYIVSIIGFINRIKDNSKCYPMLSKYIQRYTLVK